MKDKESPKVKGAFPNRAVERLILILHENGLFYLQSQEGRGWPLLLNKSHFPGPFQSDLVIYLLVSFPLDIYIKIRRQQRLLLKLCAQRRKTMVVLARRGWGGWLFPKKAVRIPSTLPGLLQRPCGPPPPILGVESTFHSLQGDSQQNVAGLDSSHWVIAGLWSKRPHSFCPCLHHTKQLGWEG